MQLNPFNPYFGTLSGNSILESYQNKKAQKLYNGILARRKTNRLRNLVKRGSTELLNLALVIKSVCLGSRHYSGLRTVEISKIRGSEDRSKDFDISFLPLLENQRDRWQSVATARLEAKPLPPVELVQVGDTYFVRDGHHRISVAKALGEEFIEANIVAWNLCDPQDQAHPSLMGKS